MGAIGFDRRSFPSRLVKAWKGRSPFPI